MNAVDSRGGPPAAQATDLSANRARRPGLSNGDHIVARRNGLTRSDSPRLDAATIIRYPDLDLVQRHGKRCNRACQRHHIAGSRGMKNWIGA